MNAKQQNAINTQIEKIKKWDNVIDEIETEALGDNVLVTIKYHMNGLSSSLFNECKMYRIGPQGGIRSERKVY